MPKATSSSLSLAALARKLMLAVFLLFAGWQTAFASPSACTAMWGVGASTLQYWNGTAWIPVATHGQAGANALGGTAVDGSLYFGNATATPFLLRADFSNTAGSITFANVATSAIVQTPTTGTYLSYTNTASVSTQASVSAYNFVGATFDRDLSTKRMYIYATGSIPAGNVPTPSTPGSVLGFIGLLNPEVPSSVSWKVVYETQGAGTVTYPELNTSGDIFADQQNGGQLWVVTNLAAPANRIYKVNISNTGYTLNSAQVVGTASFFFGAVTQTGSAAGIAVEPSTGKVWITTAAAGTTTRVIDHSSAPVVGDIQILATGVADSGNCVDKPDPPTVSKTFNPSTQAAQASAVTTTMTITINNPNYVPIFLNASITDTFSSNLKVNASQVPVVTCYSNGVQSTRPTSTTFTASSLATGSTTATIVAGSMIPGGNPSGGSCSFAVSLTTTTAGFYINTVPAGSVSTTAGINAAAASATYNYATTDFSVTKYQRVGSAGSTTTSAITVGTSSTINYIVTFLNNASSSSSASITFTDSMPMGLTNTAAGGLAALTASIVVSTIGTVGSCAFIGTNINSGNIGVRIDGTVTGVTAGSGCQLTIPVSSSSTATTNNRTNTASLTVLAPSADANTTNNVATVTYTALAAQANLTIAKTNQVTTLVPSGTTSYTITVANLGPSAATNALVQDAPGTGLLCSSVTCSPGTGATCPTAGSTTMSYLSGSGIQLTTFASGHTLNFVVNCTVSATGQ